jgi:hypothetical protein
MSCHIKWISGVCNLLMNMSNKAHSCIKCPVACVVAGPHSPRFLSVGILERMLLQESPPHTHNTGDEVCC